MHHAHDGQRAVGLGDKLEADARHAEVHQAAQKVGRDAAEVERRDERLLFLEQAELVVGGREDFDDEVGSGEGLPGVGRDLRADLGVFGVGEVREVARAGLDGHLVAGGHEDAGAVGRQGDAALVVAGLARHADVEPLLLLEHGDGFFQRDQPALDGEGGRSWDFH